MVDLYIFKKSENPEFLVGPLEDWCYYEDRDRFLIMGQQFIDKLKQHNPEVDYPFLALTYDVILDTEDLCFLRPDSQNLGGLRGGLIHWSKDYDASTSEGLARMIHEEFSKPESHVQHLNPITCVVDFIRNHPVLDTAYQILENQYKYNIMIVNIE